MGQGLEGMQFLCYLPQLLSERSQLVLPSVPAQFLANLAEAIAAGRDDSTRAVKLEPAIELLLNHSSRVAPPQRFSDHFRLFAHFCFA